MMTEVRRFFQSYLCRIDFYIPCNCAISDEIKLNVEYAFSIYFLLPMTTKFKRGLPPCLFSSSALILIACRAFPEERPGVGTVEGSSPFDPLDGVSGRLDMTSVAGITAAFSGLAPRRTEAVVVPFSPVLRREHEEV